jgi:hypothetical protein
MIYIKSILAGLVAAVAAALIYVLVTVVLPIVFAMLMSNASGSGGGAFVSTAEGPLLGMALIGFIAGFAWEFRRASRRRVSP